MSLPLLAALQVGDSAFPSGGFAQSWGLETALRDGRANRASLGAWIEAELLDRWAPFDRVALALGWDGEPEAAETVATAYWSETALARSEEAGAAADPVPAPGEYILAEGEIELNAGRPVTEIAVLNTGDRTIQVRSHAQFFEVNRALSFDRRAAWGMRLDRPSGAGERFDPGIAKTVRLVAFGGLRRMHGFAGLAEGGEEVRDAAFARAAARGYMGDAS